MDSEKLQQLKHEIQQEMYASLKMSNFDKVLKKYGISGQRVFTIDCMLDLSKLESDESVSEQSQELLPVTSDEKIRIGTLAWCNPCPAPGFPLGCHC